MKIYLAFLHVDQTKPGGRHVGWLNGSGNMFAIKIIRATLSCCKRAGAGIMGVNLYQIQSFSFSSSFNAPSPSLSGH